MTTRPRRQGFTLIEVLVAMSAGVLVAIAALLLAKNATRFFQHEARISAAQLALTLGMNRLTTDLQRASFLASPAHHGAADTHLCQDGVALPPSISNWVGLGIRVRGSELDHPIDLAQGLAPENQLHPDSVIIGGSLATTEQFSVKLMPPSVGANQMILEAREDEAMGRLRSTAKKSGQTLDDALQPIFTSGRFLRVYETSNPGSVMYAIVRGVSAVGPPGNETVTVTLDPSLRFPDKRAGATCGSGSLGHGNYVASVVYRVKYDIRSLQNDPNYKRLVAYDPAVATVSGEDTRTELVRVELDETGAEKAQTLELVSELAVDLKFGITRSNQGFTPTMSTFTYDDPAADTSGTSMTGTLAELVRAVHVRLSTRTRVPDRETPLTVDAHPYRFAVKPAPLTPRFARVRTMHTTVSLPNQGGFTP